MKQGETELYKALEFLELGSKGLGRRLLKEVRRAADQIGAFPLLRP